MSMRDTIMSRVVKTLDHGNYLVFNTFLKTILKSINIDIVFKIMEIIVIIISLSSLKRHTPR